MYILFYTTRVFVFGATTPPPSEQGSPHSRVFLITYDDAPQSIKRVRASDQLVAETSTWQHKILTTDRRPCRRWDSNPQSQQAQTYAKDRAHILGTASYGYLFLGARDPGRPRPHNSRGLQISHNDAPRSAGLFWTRDQLVYGCCELIYEGIK